MEKALELEPHAPDGIVLELGTGSGAIAIAFGNECPHRHVLAVEKEDAALTIAHANIKAQAQANVTLIQADWLSSIAGNTIAMLLSNPPYLASSDPHLATLHHEPRNALVSGKTGLEALEHIIEHSAQAMLPGASLILEHGCEQGATVRQRMFDCHYQSIATCHDLAGLERVSIGFHR